MMSSPLEMPNPVEDQAVRMVAPTSEAASSVSSHKWHDKQHLRVVRSHPQPTHSGAPLARGHFDARRNGNLSSPLCRQSGFTGMK